MRQLFKSKLLGGILIIAGTTLGVGMLAFPTVTAIGGFIPSTVLFFLIWAVMLASAFCFLDANLSIKGPANMITMAEKTLGILGKLVSWVIYLLLLYSLTAAYIAGSTPLFVETFARLTGYTIPDTISPFILPLLFGGFIYAGTRGVDLANRILMVGLVIAYLCLVFFLPEHVDTSRFAHVDFPAITLAIPVVITAFGYHIVIPSLSIYMKQDRKQLVKAILIGSFIPITVYLLWQTLVIGAVPLDDLVSAYKNGEAATHPLAKVMHKPVVSAAAKLFTFFAIVTSFIGVTLSLSDFLTDGFKIKKSHTGRVLAMLLTFLPPLFFVYSYPRAFYTALQYAGAFVAILLVFLPAAMVWNHRRYKNFIGRAGLIILCLIALAIVVLDILAQSGKLSFLTNHYNV